MQLHPTPGKRLFIVKDVRVFINTINRAIDTMKNAGIDARLSKRGKLVSLSNMLVRIPWLRKKKLVNIKRFDIMRTFFDFTWNKKATFKTDMVCAIIKTKHKRIEFR